MLWMNTLSEKPPPISASWSGGELEGVGVVRVARLRAAVDVRVVDVEARLREVVVSANRERLIGRALRGSSKSGSSDRAVTSADAVLQKLLPVARRHLRSADERRARGRGAGRVDRHRC